MRHPKHDKAATSVQQEAADQDRKPNDQPAGGVPPPQASDAVQGSDGASPAAAVQLLQGELEETRQRMLRAQADLENYRKRALRELEEERRYANLPLLRDLLPVWDNVHRAVQAAEKAPDTAGLVAGFKMVAQQLAGVFSRHHCTRIEALGQAFDPHQHAAICQQPSAEHPANTVVSVAQDGFQLHDRVIRPAQVIVSTAPPAEPEP